MAQTFTFVYSDPYGAADFWYVEAEFYAYLQAPPWYVDCTVLVYPGSGTLWLGSNSLTLGTPGTLQTNQCAVNVAASSGSMSANAYTLTLSLSFTSAFAGIKTTVDGDAVNGGGVSTSSTLGTWTVPNCTVTFDTTASVSDVQRVINEALGTWSPTDDLNLDGIVNIADVQIVLNAALNLGCS
jgi:hypothetical protein